jgi:hypothetical protein
MVWTEKKNKKRCFLIEKEIKESITEEEKLELDKLQEEMLAYRRKVSPLPLEDLRAFKKELERKKNE